MRKIVAFIPVRGGSKSIPLKNIKNFCGKPLVYWTAKAASECDYIEKVYISTDSDEIHEVVESLGLKKVQVIGRSSETASDTASTESAMLEFAEGQCFDDIILIQATSPLLEKKDLEIGVKSYLDDGYDSLLSVVRQKRFIWSFNRDGAVPENYEPQNRPRRQEMQGYLVENGAFYITKRNCLLRSRCRLSGRIGLYEMDEKTYFEVDEPNDWSIMEKLKVDSL